MRYNYSIKNTLVLLITLFRYNLKVIFANKFIYYLLAAVAFFLMIVIISLFSDRDPQVYHAYYWLLFPGLLLVFYPTVYGIQNDADSRMLETIFGIPNYRYKIWLVRMVQVYLVVAVILFLLCLLCNFALLDLPVFRMVFEIMYPVFYIGCLAFMFSTLIKNGNGTAVLMVILGMGYWMGGGIFLRNSKWNIFLNPFRVPPDMNEIIWQSILFNNRLIIVIYIVIFLLVGLFYLQKREKYI